MSLLTTSRAFASLALASALVLGACASGDTTASDPTPGGTTMDGTSSTSSTTSTTAPPPATSRSFATVTEPATDLAGYNVYRPDDLAATGEPLPVVVWANGGCVRHDATWATLLERWASAGFVVVAITTPPEGQGSATDATSAADQAKAIDWAEEQNVVTGGPFEGHLDLDRVVAAGNSCGGITSIQLAASDPRVRSVFVLSGSSTSPVASRDDAAAVMKDVTVPLGFAVGGPDEDIASPQALQDIDLLADGIPGFVANRASGDHVTVSTDPASLADVAEIGINWMDFTLYDRAAAKEALQTDPCGDCATDGWTVTTKSF